ncbi:MAG: hypothetical protein NZ482_10240, partial [Gloeomargarita sp. SKYG98]|nr:hypothetical protein [Gloeomargarita sp. SKYG98]
CDDDDIDFRHRTYPAARTTLVSGDSDNTAFTKLIAAQDFEGFWPLSSELMRLLGWDKAKKAKRAIAALKNAGIAKEIAEKIVATLLALDALQQRFGHRQVEWQLLAQKAECWLQQLALTPPGAGSQPADLVTRWRQWYERL